MARLAGLFLCVKPRLRKNRQTETRWIVMPWRSASSTTKSSKVRSGFSTKRIARLLAESDTARQRRTMPGVGPVTALAIKTFAPAMDSFRNGRNFAAWLGLVPLQHSSGGRQVLGRTSKMG